MRDYHMHTRFCRHAVGHAADYAREALARGIGEICFTPHIPLPGFRPGFWNDRLRMDEKEFDEHLAELESARSLFPNLSILSGVEADYIPSMEGYLARFIAGHPFDFVLMSIHYVSSWDEDEWVFGFHRRRSLRSAYGDYFREMIAGIDTGLFDCVAHLDLIKQRGNPVLATNRDDVEAVLQRCLASGMSAEINTSGTRKEIAEAYPCDEIVRLMIEREVPLVSSSDAHGPAQVGYGFSELGERFEGSLARSLVGYRGRDMLRLAPRHLRARAGHR
jgi:histidinol-phosphatase (PHP family)